MDCLPKKSELLLDEEIEKQEFVKIKIQFTNRNVISMPYLIIKIAHVARSGFYKWLKRKISASEKQLDDEEIKKKIIGC